MLTRILHNSSELCEFIKMLELKLSKPQQRHIINVVDGLIVTETSKTLAEIQRQFVRCVDPTNITVTFRIAPWITDDIRPPLIEFLIKTTLEHLEQQGQPRRLLINLDDSLAIKDPDTRCLQGVDSHYDHTIQRKKATSYSERTRLSGIQYCGW